MTITPEIELASVSDALAALGHSTDMLRAVQVGQALAIAAICDLHRVGRSVHYGKVSPTSCGGRAIYRDMATRRGRCTKETRRG